MRGIHRRGAGRSVEFAAPHLNRVDPRLDVVCPCCGDRAIDAGRGARPRWACRDRDCAFARGWLLDFVDPPRPITNLNAHETGRPAPPMFAFPFDSDGELRRELAVPWPRSAP